MYFNAVGIFRVISTSKYMEDSWCVLISLVFFHHFSSLVTSLVLCTLQGLPKIHFLFKFSRVNDQNIEQTSSSVSQIWTGL